MWELRAAIALARYCETSSNTEAGQDVLAPLYGWFIEGSTANEIRAGEPSVLYAV